MEIEHTDNGMVAGPFTVRIEQDIDPFNPRAEFDHFGNMSCSHKRYVLGDKEHELNADNFNGWDEVEEWLIEEEGAHIILPLYMIDHSGLSINTTGFSCPWDSGQIGFIWCTKKQVDDEFSGDEERAKNLLLAEVNEYSQYLEGDVWGFVIEDEEGEHIDSCWGFYGHEYVMEEAENILKCHIEKYEEEQAMLKEIGDHWPQACSPEGV